MKPLEIDTFTSYHFLSSVQLSPDGQQAAFIVKQADCKENDYSSNIWLYSLADERLCQLTTSNHDTAFSWLPDSRQILFLSKRDHSDPESSISRIFRISIDGGEATLACTLAEAVETITVIDERRFLYSAAIDLDAQSTPKDESHQDHQARLASEKEEEDYHVLDEIPFWANGKGYRNKKRTHLFSFDLETGQAKDLTEGTFQLHNYDLLHGQVILAGVEYHKKAPLTNDLFLLDLATETTTRLTEGTHAFGQPRFMAPSTIVVAASSMQQFGLNENRALHAFHLDERRLENLTPELDKSLTCSVGSDCKLGRTETFRSDAEHFYFLTTERESSFLNVLTLDGEISRVIDYPGAVNDFDIAGDTIIYVALRENRLQELYRWHMGKEVQLTRLNDAILQDVKLSKPEHFAVQTTDDNEIDAWIMKPVDLEPGKRYPAILEIHGGPKSVSSDVFFHEYQLFASENFVVFYCNPRGSDGKGNEFADIRGKYGTIDYQDIMAVVDHVVAHYDFVDPDRLGVTGGSYGGFMTNWIIGHSNRFKAAVSQRSISNWVSFGYTTDIGYYFMPDQMDALPWDNIDKIWTQSPLKYADQVKTPTLFIHSAEDYRCWLPEGLQMFTALQYFGIESRLVIFDGENHELSRGGKPKHRIRRLREILSWFREHL